MVNKIFFSLVGLIGIFSLLGALFNWNFLYARGRGKAFVENFGQTIARLIYGVFGVLVIAFSIYALSIV